ncbi:MAG: Flagellar hook-length control protein FliK [Myxococcales bacterium]|nr:Flagellar hook-length control protein FliK [Myxococcales bacterium]
MRMRQGVLLVVALAGCGRIGFTSAGSGSDGDGSVAVGDAAPRDGTGDGAALQANRVFVTSTRQTPALGGLAGADAMCQARATAAGLPGTYVALLSTTATNAKDRLALARGWVRSDGLPFADSPASLFAGQVFYPIRLDENGTDIGGFESSMTYAFTATSEGGVYTGGGDCGGFTSTAMNTTGGITFAGTSAWTSTVTMICNQSLRLLCFGVDRSVPVIAPIVQGRIAFLSTVWMTGSGIVGADARCTTDATAAGLPGTYHALLATSTASATSRFVTTGARWVRPDGVVVVDPASTLATGAAALASINVTAAGSYVAQFLVDTGASATNVAGTNASTCSDWTSVATNQFPSAGIGYESGAPAFFYTTNRCSDPAARVYCFQD